MRKVVLLASLSACSYFPSHEEVFIPVPLALGEARVVDGDTSWVLASETYELVAPRQELLPEARRGLDEAAEQFRAIFGVAPARVTVALREPREAAADDGAEKPPALPTGEAGGDVVPVPVPPPIRARGGVPARPRPIPLAPVARAWLSTYVDARAGSPRLRTAFAGSAPLAEDPRLPDWLEDGIVQVVAGHPARDVLLAQLARERSDALPLRQLFSMPRPGGEQRAADDPMLGRADDRRPVIGGRLEGARLFSVQAYGVARFVADREGRQVLGAMVDRVVAGETALAALATARHLTPDPDVLQRAWESWLEEEFERRR